MAMVQTGSLFHLAHQSTRIGCSDLILSSIAAVHLSSTPCFGVRKEFTNHRTAAYILTAIIDGDILNTQVVDRADDLSEDTYGLAGVGYRGIMDEVAAAIIVTLENTGMTDRRPCTTPSGI